MAVAKKHIRRAVDRNRLKRLIRESFRTGLIPVTVDIVVMPRASCLGVDNGDLIISLHKQWSRISSKCAKQCAT
jgi:ribonuclease P protein component